MAYFFLSIFCFVLIIHVQSVKVIQNKDGNLVLKGITNWEQIKQNYMNHRDFSKPATAIDGGLNKYDGGDIIVYNEDSGHPTEILFYSNGKRTPYHYLHQNLHDCSFEFQCKSLLSCLFGASKLNILPHVLIAKIKRRQISFSPDPKHTPVNALSGLRMRRKSIDNHDKRQTSNLEFYNYDKREFERDPTLKHIAQSSSVEVVSDLWINIGSDNEENAKFVSYRGGGAHYFGEKLEINGMILHQTQNDKARFAISFSDFLNECEKRKVAVGKNHDAFIHSYDGDYGLKASDQCVPYSETAKLPPATAPDFELHAVKELPPPIPPPLVPAVISAHYDEYDDDLQLEELYDELEQLERSKAYLAGYDKGFNEETRMKRLKHRLNQ